MNPADLFMTSLVLWRENRGGGTVGMQSVANAIQHRVAANHSTFYEECTKHLQFSSITAPGDPQLALWPISSDPTWVEAQNLAAQAVGGTLADLVMGAELYYDPGGIKTTKSITLPTGQTVPFPQTWNPAVVEFTVAIAGHYFFKQK